MASIFLDHAIEYDGTGVRLADVLPVPRCKLPLQPRLDRRSTTAAFQTSRRPGGSSYSPLEYLRRQEAREQDQEPPKSLGTVCAELILQAFAPGLLLSMTWLAYQKRHVVPSRPGTIDPVTVNLRRDHWPSGDSDRYADWVNFTRPPSR